MSTVNTLNVPQIILGKDSNSLNISSSVGITAGALNIFVGTSTGTTCSDLVLNSGISSDGLSVYTSGSIYLTPGISFSTNSFMGSIYKSGYNIYSGWTDVSTVAILTITSWASVTVPLSTVVLGDIIYSSKLNQFVMISTTTYGYTSNDAITWNTVQVGSNGGWNAFTWSDYLGLYCAIQYNGIICSTDGVIWNTRVSVTGNWNNICWSNDLKLFCSVANAGIVMISSDSYSWTTYRAMSSSYNLTNVCYSDVNKIFCAISSTISPSNLVGISYNGILWYTYNSAVSVAYYAICYSDEIGMFCAVGNTGNIMTSTSGTSWISRTSNVSSSFRDIIYSSELSSFIGLSLSNIVLSNDGINWISKTSPLNGSSQACIWVGKYSKLYIMSNLSGTPRLYNSVGYYNNMNNLTRIGTRGSTSNTLIEGNTLKLGSGSLEVDIGYNAENINFGTSLYTNVNIYGNMNMLNSNISVYYSSISNTTLPNVNNLSYTSWINNSLFSTANQLNNITWVEELGYFYCCNSGGIYRSNDGIYWTTPYMFGETSSNKKRIVWSPQLNLLFGYSTSTTMYSFKSTNGLNWITQYVTNMAAFTDFSKCICWSEGLRIFCALSTTPTNANRVLIYDGINYSSYFFNQLNVSFNDICWSNSLNVFCASGSSQYIFISYDAINWLTYTSTPLINFNALEIIYSSKFNKFTICGFLATTGIIIQSSDLITWNVTTLYNSGVYALSWSNQLEIYVGGVIGNLTNDIIYSNNSINWYTLGLLSILYPLDICFSPKLSRFCLLAVDQNTSIYYSSSSSNIYPNINKQLTLGTSGSISTTNLLGNQINIGNGSDIITIGNNYAYNVNIGPVMNIVNINSPLYGLNNVLDTYYSGLGISSITGIQNLCVNSWTITTIPSNSFFTCDAWSDNLNMYVIGNSYNTTSLTTMAYSFDGKTWSYVTAPSGLWDSVCWSSELKQFLAVEDAGAQKVMKSINGILWTTISQSIGTGNWINLCWSKALYLYAVCSRGGSPTVSVSKNGITWTSSNKGLGNTGGYYSICWAEELGMFCTVGDNNDTSFSPPRNFVLTSYDGLTWSTNISPSSVASWSGLCWSPELYLFCAVASNNPYVMRSSNGLSWTSSGSVLSCYRVCWASQISLFLGTSNDNTNSLFMYSPDTFNWYTCNIGVSVNNWRGVTWSPKLSQFIASCAFYIASSSYTYLGISKGATVGAEGITNVNITGNTIEIGKSSNLVEIGKYSDRTLIYNQPLYYGFNSSLLISTPTIPNYDILINNVPPGAYIAEIWCNSIFKSLAPTTTMYNLYITGFNTINSVSQSLYISGIFDPFPTSSNNINSSSKYFMSLINVNTYLNIGYTLFTTIGISVATTFSLNQQRSFLLTPYY